MYVLQKKIHSFLSLDIFPCWPTPAFCSYLLYLFNVSRFPVLLVVVQLLSCVWLFVTPWTATLQASLSSTISQSFLKLKSIESVMLSNHLILCCPLSSCPQSFSASRSFAMSWLLTSGGQNIGASASILPMNIQGWFPLVVVAVSFTQSCPTLWPHGLWPARLLCPWDSPGKDVGVDCHSLLQKILLTQGLNPGLLHCSQILYHVSYREDPLEFPLGLSYCILPFTWFLQVSFTNLLCNSSRSHLLFVCTSLNL